MNKLTSRKLWISIAGVATGIALVVSGEVTSGTTMIISSVLGYVATEGLVDIARIVVALKEISDVADGVSDALGGDADADR